MIFLKSKIIRFQNLSILLINIFKFFFNSNKTIHLRNLPLFFYSLVAILGRFILNIKFEIEESFWNVLPYMSAKTKRIHTFVFESIAFELQTRRWAMFYLLSYSKLWSFREQLFIQIFLIFWKLINQIKSCLEITFRFVFEND